MSFFATVNNLLLHERSNRPILSIKIQNSSITKRMIYITIDWMTSVCDMFKLRLDTYFLAVDIFRICLRNIASIVKDTLQLYATTSIMIAAKKYECFFPEIADYIYVVDGAFVDKTLINAEIIVIKLLGANLEIANIAEYHRYIRCKYFEEYPNNSNKSEMLMQTTNMICMYWVMLEDDIIPSVIVTAAFHIAKIYVISDVDDKYTIYNPFNADEKFISRTCQQHIKNILQCEKSSLKAIRDRFIKKIKVFSTTYEKFITFMNYLQKVYPSDDCFKEQFLSLKNCSLEKNVSVPFVNEDDYNRDMSIGSGTFGNVFIVHDSKFTKCAMKIVESEYFQEGLPSHYLREISVLSNIKHDNIIKITGILSNFRGFIMELMDSDLKGYYGNNSDVIKDESFQIFVTSKLLLGLKYIHDKGIMNRDIKPQNILVRGIWGENFEIKICDFGICRGMNIAISGTSSTSEICTLWYRPIEILLGSHDFYGPTIDIWSLGCTLYETFTKRVLFHGDCDIDQIHSIFRIMGTPDKTHPLRKMNDYPQNLPDWKNTFDDRCDQISQKILTIIKLMIEYDPVKRPIADTLLRLI